MYFPITPLLHSAYTCDGAWLTAPAHRADNGRRGRAALRAPVWLLAHGHERENAVAGDRHARENDAAWEAECVARVLSGERDAFAQVVHAYARRIFTHIFRLLRVREEAEDVVQETFLCAYRNLERFDRARSFRNWLYAIATNLALNALRARQRRGVAVALEFDGEATMKLAGAGADSARAAATRHDLAERLARAVALLPAQPAALVHLHYLEGMTIREAAETLGMSEDAAKVALHRARKRLRESMGEME